MDSFSAAKCCVERINNLFGIFETVFFTPLINRWRERVVFVIGNRCSRSHSRTPQSEKNNSGILAHSRPRERVRDRERERGKRERDRENGLQLGHSAYYTNECFAAGLYTRHSSEDVSVHRGQ